MSAISARRGSPAALRGSVRTRPDPAWLVALLTALAAAGLALSCRAVHVHLLPEVVLIGAGALVLVCLSGDALALALVPASWSSVRPLLSLPLGAAASGMGLMAFGVAHVPLSVSLWLWLGLGLGASVWVRRRLRARTGPVSATAAGRGPWVITLALLFLIALIPAWRTDALTIYGQNPDSSQVVGIAVLFQHVAPTATDVRLPLDVVPQEWRFRYPIFYPLAAVSNLVHVDPIRAFAVLSAGLMIIAALGYGLVAVRCFRAPAWAGPAVAALLGFTWILQYLAWHPYWNQLWGTALMPYAILLGWHALEARDGRAGIAAGLLLLMLWFAYPLALPYPLVVLAGVAAATWRGFPRPHIRSGRGALAALAALALLLPAVAGSVLKLKEAIGQLLTPSSNLWGGDVKHFLSPGKFVGTGGGTAVGALCGAVALGAAAVALRRLAPRVRAGVGAGLIALLALDLRFRLTASGPYMDFKHLSFVGLFVLALAFAGLLATLAAPGWARRAAAVLLLAWAGAALALDHRTAELQNEQVTPELLQIRQWAAQIPARASVRVDIPPADGGLQLWAVYMLGDHPVDSYEPLKGTTYAYATPGFRADFSLSLSTDPATGRPYPQPRYTVDRPVRENDAFVLRRMGWPRRFDSVAQTASTRLVEP